MLMKIVEKGKCTACGKHLSENDGLFLCAECQKISIGKTLYFVMEHLYYEPEHAGPKLEYVVCSGEIKAFLEGPKKLVRLYGFGPDACKIVEYRSVRELGKTLFLTEREAALHAKVKTEDYEKRFGWTERWGDVPLRRPWEKLLGEPGEAQ